MAGKNELSVFIPEYARKIMDTMRDEGEEIYIVGGCLRDTMLGKLPEDYDMAISCLPEKTEEILIRHGFRTIATGLKHGTVTAISDGKPIEITTFRIDGEYTDSRHPTSVSFTRTLSKDLCRRDFTVNAMAYNEACGLVDLFGGQEDLHKRVIRAVGSPEKRFEEDALRIMRAFRFSAQLGFDIDEVTLVGAEKCRAGLEKISRERIRTELLKLLMSDNAEKALSLMYEKGILAVAAECDFSDKDEKNIKNIFSLVSQMPKTEAARLGFLLCLWDREDEAGAKCFVTSLKCSNKLKTTALAVRAVAFECISTEKEAARLCAKFGREATALGACASRLLKNSPSRAERLVEESQAPAEISELKISGAELMAVGFQGKQIGVVLSSLLEKAVDGELKNDRAELLAAANEMKNNFEG